MRFAILSQRGENTVSPYDERLLAYSLTLSRLSLEDFSVKGVDPTDFKQIMHAVFLSSASMLIDYLDSKLSSCLSSTWRENICLPIHQTSKLAHSG